MKHDPTVDLVRAEAHRMTFRRHRYVTQDQLNEALRRLDALEASQQQNQQQIDAETAKVQANEQKLATLQQEIDALKQQPGAQSLDFSKLDAALAAESTQTDADVADAAPPAPPAPPAGQ